MIISKYLLQIIVQFKSINFTKYYTYVQLNKEFSEKIREQITFYISDNIYQIDPIVNKS